MRYKKIGKSKSSCLICGLSKSTMNKKSINWNTHRGQVYCEKDFLSRVERIETEEIIAKTLKQTIKKRFGEMKERINKII